MRSRRFIIAPLCTAAAITVAGSLFAADVPIPPQLSSLIKKDVLIITPQPVLMSDSLALLCVSPKYLDKVSGEYKPLIDPHGKRFAVVFSNGKAADPIRAGDAEYPEGSVVAKAKYLDAEANKLELVTYMKKMASGYNRDHGDWQYGVIDSSGQLQQSGLLWSCMACHDKYKATGYVSRKYLRVVEPKVKDQ